MTVNSFVLPSNILSQLHALARQRLDHMPRQRDIDTQRVLHSLHSPPEKKEEKRAAIISRPRRAKKNTARIIADSAMFQQPTEDVIAKMDRSIFNPQSVRDS